MRLVKGLALSLTGVGLAGCAFGGSSLPSAAGPSGASPRVVISTAPAVPRASRQTRTQARTAAARFYSLYSASQFAAFWSLLSPATKHQVSRRVWVGVHDACPSPGAGKPRIIKAVTVFGGAAIITEKVPRAAAKAGPAEDVFNYAHGRWSYSPADLSVYDHGSVAADVAAARTAGLCAGWKIF